MKIGKTKANSTAGDALSLRANVRPRRDIPAKNWPKDGIVA